MKKSLWAIVSFMLTIALVDLVVFEWWCAIPITKSYMQPATERLVYGSMLFDCLVAVKKYKFSRLRD